MAVKTIEAGTGESVVLKANQTLRILDPLGGQSGDLVAFREEMDLSIAISACSSPTCNGGKIKPVQFEILD
jgi:uncharacterized protein YcgI (DUF1989 family)